MRESTRTALITGVAVVLGGLVAGGAGILTTIVTQQAENERVEHRLDEEARGAARVLTSRLRTTLSYTGATLEVGEYLISEPEFVAPVSADDLQLVTARLSVDEYRAVDAALRDTSAFFALLDGAPRGATLAASDRENIRILRTEINAGRKALLEVADLRE